MHVPLRLQLQALALSIAGLSSASCPANASGPYAVHPGDSLWTVAGKHLTSVTALARLNGLKVGAPLVIGDKLLLPGSVIPQVPGATANLDASPRDGVPAAISPKHETTHSNTAVLSRIEGLTFLGISGTALQRLVEKRAEGITPLNRPYHFDGVQDCYGFIRQVWNPILADGRVHEEDSTDTYTWGSKRERVECADGLPVGTAPDMSWARFSDPRDLYIGDIVATDQGHRWGTDWHGGIYAGLGRHGTPLDWDCSAAENGAYKRTFRPNFRYYYVPLHKLLAPEHGTNQPQPRM